MTTIGIGLGIAFFCSVEVIRLSGPDQGPDDADRLKWLVGTSLVMCLVGVTNSMLMSVAERFREIGTIKCLGSSDGFILRVFFLEAALLGFAGSLAGSLLGTLFMTAAQQVQSISVTFQTVMTVVATGTSIGLGMTVLAAVVPAYQAAKMPAAAALRVEV